MGRPPSSSGGPSKSKGSSASLSETDMKVYELIKNHGNVGIWIADIRRETKLAAPALTKCLTTLQNRNMVKQVANVNSNKKVYMLYELEPSKEVTGGTWYTGKTFDVQLIETLQKVCLDYIRNEKVATLESIVEYIKRTGISTVEFDSMEIKQILDTLVLDKSLEEVVSTGKGIFASVPIWKNCYRCYKGGGGDSYVSPFVQVPCGVCPKIQECTPDGLISPTTCVYFKEWLQF